jgi:hypothetical protein
MKFEVNNKTGALTINGNDYFEDYDGYDVYYKAIESLNLSSIPIGKSINLIEKVIGGGKRDYYSISPSAKYSNNLLLGLIAELSIIVFDEEDYIDKKHFHDYVEYEIKKGIVNLEKHFKSGIIFKQETKIYDESAFFTISIKLNDMTFKDAVSYISDIEDQFYNGGALEKYLFISHASEDKEIAEKIFVDLKKRGIQSWFDKYEIFIGDSIVEKVSSGLESSTELIILLSKNSVEKKWVKKELNTVIMNKLNGKEVRILPVKIDDCVIPQLLVEYKYSDFKNGYEACIYEIVESIRKYK